MYKVRLQQQKHFRIVCGFYVHGSGKPRVVVLPSQLECTSPIVLLLWLRWEVLIVPPASHESTVGQIAIPIGTTSLLQKFETLGPPCVRLSVSRPCGLCPVSEEGRKFALARLLEALTLDVCLATEGGELGHGFEEVLVGVDRVSVKEDIGPVGLVDETCDERDVVERRVCFID